MRHAQLHPPRSKSPSCQIPAYRACALRPIRADTSPLRLEEPCHGSFSAMLEMTSMLHGNSRTGIPAGHDVWWDRRLHGGSRFAKEIDQALKNAEAVVVLWSAESVKSAWVQDEAAEGRDTQHLVPSIGSAKPPLGFRQFHTIDLGAWNGNGRPKVVNELFDAIGQTCASPPGQGQPNVTEMAAGGPRCRSACCRSPT